MIYEKLNVRNSDTKVFGISRDKERTERKDLQSKEGKAEVATCQWLVFSNDRSEAEIGKKFRNGFEADLFLQNYLFLLDYDVT